MQILYVLAMIAVFVLCIALLSTARRILKSPALASGQLGLSRVAELDLAVEEPVSRRSTDSMTAAYENEPVSLRAAEEMAYAEIFEPAPAMPAVVLEVAEPLGSIPAPQAYTEGPEEPLAQKTSALSRLSHAVRSHKPSRRTYNYALECALLGVSAWVLIKTQQGTLHEGSWESSRGRVA